MQKKLTLISIFLVVLLVLFFGGSAYTQAPDDDVYGLGYALHQKTNFSKEEIKTLVDLLEGARKDGMDTDFLIKRVREGIAKKATFDSIEKVLEEKTNNLKISKKLIDEYIKLGIRYNKKDYCEESLNILVDKGLKEADFRAISNLVLLRKMKLEDSIFLCKLLQDKGFDREIKDIIVFGLLEEHSISEIKRMVKKHRKTK